LITRSDKIFFLLRTESLERPDCCPIDLDNLASTLTQAILNREYFETRHNTVCDDGLVGLISVTTVVMKHNPPFKSNKTGLEFLKKVSFYRNRNIFKEDVV